MYGQAARHHDVADTFAITPEQLRRQCREQEDGVDAWFGRADATMLIGPGSPDVPDLFLGSACAARSGSTAPGGPERLRQRHPQQGIGHLQYADGKERQ